LGKKKRVIIKGDVPGADETRSVSLRGARRRRFKNPFLRIFPLIARRRRRRPTSAHRAALAALFFPTLFNFE